MRISVNTIPASLLTTLRRVHVCYAGTQQQLSSSVESFKTAGATHLVMRFAGDHERHLEPPVVRIVAATGDAVQASFRAAVTLANSSCTSCSASGVP